MQRITQKDLAKAAGVHPATVSLALRGHSSIPEPTQKRIKQLAWRMGYTADPVLSALAAYRSRQLGHPPAQHTTIALVDNWPAGTCWHASADHSRTRAAVLSRAQELGFRVQEFSLGTDSAQQERASRKIFMLGIRGLILAPQPPDMPGLSMAWQRFTVVNLGNRLLEPVFHCSMPDIFANYRILVKVLLSRGYRRLGAYFPLLVGDDTQDAYASLFIESNILGWHGSRMFFAEPLLMSHWNQDAFMRWVKANRLDVIATSEPQIPEVLLSEGYKIPDQIGVAYTPCRTHATASGVYALEENIGATAVDLLQTQLHLGRVGVPKYPLRISHPGSWVEGSTIRLPTESTQVC